MLKVSLAVILAAAILLWAAVAMIHPVVGELRAATTTLIHVLERQEPMATVYESSWVDAEGVTHTVKTDRLPDETPADHANRHKADVDALKLVFPPAQ